MVKRLIGSDTTGTDGSVSIPYTGTGAGLVNLSVETEIDGSIVSVTYGVLDCIFYDTGIDSTFDKWVKKNATLDKEVLSDGTLVTNPNNSFGTIYANINESSTWADLYDYSAPLKVELDIVTISGGGSITLNDGVNPVQMVFPTYPFAENDHVIITVESNRYKVQIGNTEYNWYNHSLADKFGIAIRLNDTNSSIKFKNFKIYPINSVSTN